MYTKLDKFFHSLIMVAIVISVALVLIDFSDLLNTAMLFIIPIVFSAFYNDKKEVFIISVISVISFDILFIPPRFSFEVSNNSHLLTFLVMILTGQIIAYLAKKASVAKELEMATKIQDTLLQSLSHELKTPLAVIKGYSSSLLEQDLNLTQEQRIEFIEAIDENAEDMECLINNLISSAKLKNGILNINRQDCDIQEIVGSVLVKIDKNEVVSFEVDEDLICVFANPIFIEQAIVNLLDNAFKYGFNISIKISNVPNGIEIIVKNKSEILIKDEIKDATKPFVRLSNAKNQRGLGLGLHVVSLIAEIHKGELSLKSENNQFIATLFLPKSIL